MSSSSHDTEIAAPIQGVSWNEEDWQGMLKRLPSNWQEQAVKLKAWQRVRKLAQVTDLLRAAQPEKTEPVTAKAAQAKPNLRERANCMVPPFDGLDDEEHRSCPLS